MTWLGAVRFELDTCGSTNDEAAERARQGQPHGTVVTARQQTAGRGRGDHSWYSPDAENLYLSCVLRPELPPADVPPVTLAAGIAVCDAVNSFGVGASLKWPNDVLVQGRKLAGILAEMSTQGDRLEHVVLGIGVNLNGSSFPGELAATAISLRAALGDRPIDRDYFAEVLLTQLERWLDRFFAGGVAAIAAAFTERALSGRLAVTRGSDTLVGRPTGIAADGSLLIEDEAGTVHTIIAGDVRVATADGAPTP
jgi:BirA family biotin operon repressor/biotin-[acetyl-CoA-carboxylase] ligase